MQASGDEFPDRPRDTSGGPGDPNNRDQDQENRAPVARERTTAPPRRPRWALPLTLLGLLGLVVAAILAWGVAPGRKELPADTNEVRQFGGTANVLLNQQALQSGDFGGAFAQNVPVTGQETTRVLDTSGANARVIDERSLTANGQQVATASNTYAVDRTSLEPATNPPSNWNATQAQGLTVGFPVDAQQQEYAVWVPDTQSTTPANFVREEDRDGTNTFVYQADTAPAEIKDQAILQGLPADMPRAALLSPNLPIPPEQRATLTQAAPGLPGDIPITYMYQANTTYWVEPTTGTVVDTAQRVNRTAVINGPGGAMLASVPVFDVDTRNTDQSVASAVQQANDRKSSFESVSRTWPWILGALGVLALIAGLIGMRGRRRPEPVAVKPRPTVEPTTTYRPSETRAVQRDTAQRDTARRPEETDAARRARERGEPQAPYTGQTPHTGPYRDTTSGQDTVAGRAKQPEDAGDENRYPGQQGKQPPRGT